MASGGIDSVNWRQTMQNNFKASKVMEVVSL